MTISTQCTCCKTIGKYELNAKETENFLRYQQYGPMAGMIQDLLPDVPAWIRSGVTTGFCICPKCSP